MILQNPQGNEKKSDSYGRSYGTTASKIIMTYLNQAYDE